MPRTAATWTTFTASRKEAARLWNDLVERHFRIRRWNMKWPVLARWQRWAKRRYPLLSAQSAQQLVGEFVEAVQSARQLRKRGHADAKYPWRRLRYRDVTYTNQDARIRDGVLVLPHGKGGSLRIPIPSTVALPGRLMEARLAFGVASLVCEVEDVARPQGTPIGVDLGVNTLVAATDGERVVLVSGRDVKATVQWRNKKLASLSAAQAGKAKGSKRHKRLQRRKYRVLDKARRRVRDACHKATRKVADAFPGAKVYVGRPFNDAAQRLGRRQAQQVSQATTARIIAQLDYKLAGAIQLPEHFTSQTCPVCGERQKAGRVYRCRGCNTEAPRDVVGAVNILAIGEHGAMLPGRDVPRDVAFVHPSKYPGPTPGSSGGPPGNSPLARAGSVDGVVRRRHAVS